MIHRILYCSCSCLRGSPEENEAAIDAILRTSRKNNEANHVTGALLFNDKVFAQVLEGPRDAVEKIYTKICADDRHDHIILLESAKIVGRDFTNWTMAFAKADFITSRYENLSFDQAAPDPLGTADEVLRLLKSLVNARA